MRSITHLVVVAVAAATLTAAGQGSTIPARPDDKTILHVLNRTGFGARPGDVERVRQIGLGAYIEQQLRPDRVPDPALAPRLARLETNGMSTRELADDYFGPAMEARRTAQQAQRNSMPENSADRQRTPEQMEAQRRSRTVLIDLSEQKILRAAYSERQLEEVLTDFWFNHFNVFAGKGATQVYLTEYERDTIRPRVLGKFRDLLGATAKSPAMLFYLDNWQSVDPDAEQRGAAMRRRALGRRQVPDMMARPQQQRQ